MYLVAQYIKSPKKAASTCTPKFWSDQNNFVQEELIGVKRHIRNADLAKAGIILDLKNSEVIKARGRDQGTEQEQSFDHIYGYFRKHYADYIDKILMAYEGKNTSTAIMAA